MEKQQQQDSVRRSAPEEHSGRQSRPQQRQKGDAWRAALLLAAGKTLQGVRAQDAQALGARIGNSAMNALLAGQQAVELSPFFYPLPQPLPQPFAVHPGVPPLCEETQFSALDNPPEAFPPANIHINGSGMEGAGGEDGPS